MKILKAYKYRLKVSEEDRAKLSRDAGCCRLVWNKILKINESRLLFKLPIIRYCEAAAMLVLWKQSKEYDFLKECHSQVLQQKLKDLDRAYRDGFDKKQPFKRMPTVRKKGVNDSFRYPQGFKIDANQIYLPKIGWIRFFKSRDIKGTQKNVTITRKGRHWFFSVQVELDIADPKTIATSDVGIDLGIKKFAALSTGEYLEPKNNLERLYEKLASRQRKMARKKKGSNNWKKARNKVINVNIKIANVRIDFLHKASTKLSKNHAMIVVEDLKIKNMSKSAKGTMDSPGINVSAKRALNRKILEQGWGIFKRQLKYKMDWNGGLFLAVSPKHTSQKCFVCGYIDPNNRKTQENFCCVKCSHQENADTNAAKNILAAGHAVLACKANFSRSRQQEPLRISDLVADLSCSGFPAL
jgi:IS605 OrfB family transposase